MARLLSPFYGFTAYAERLLIVLFFMWAAAVYFAGLTDAEDDIYILLLGTGLLIVLCFVILIYDVLRPVSHVVLSPEEIEQRQREIEEAKAEIEFKRGAQKLIKWLQKRVPEELGRQLRMQKEEAQKMGITGERKLYRIKMPNWIAKKSEVWFPIESKHMPPGVSYWDLTNPNNHVEFVTSIGISRDTQIHVDEQYRNMFCIVSYLTGQGGLPKIVYWKDILVQMWNKPKLAVPLGINEKGDLSVQDLSEWPHGLVMGATGMGKSTFITQALCTLLLRNTPKDLEFYLIDLKGTDYVRFVRAKIPHIKAYANKQGPAIDMLKELVSIMEKRTKMFAKVPVLNIKHWNKKMKGNQLPYIFVWLDELSWLTQSWATSHKKESLPLILRLVQGGRALGINVLIGTQTPDKDTLTSPIIANVEGKFCFKLHSSPMSKVAVQTQVAATELTHPGRAVMLNASGHSYYQTPMIFESDVLDTIQRVLDGRMLQKPQDINRVDRFEKSMVAIARFALETNEGKLDWDNLYEYSNRAWPLKWGRELLKEHDGKIIDVDEEFYRIVPPQQTEWGLEPRKLVQVGSANETAKVIKIESAEQGGIAVPGSNGGNGHAG